MKGFLSPLRMENIDGHTMKLIAPLRYQTEIDPALGVIKVQAGFITDFASVPRGLWNLFPPNGTYVPAAVVHDWLYRRTIIDRKICDRVFEEAMQCLGVSWFTRKLIYRAVRLFGEAARERELSNVDKAG
jgi:hypothetical protein